MFFVEGNVGSGKSTLLKYLELNTKHKIILEPVDEWTKIKNSDGTNLLENFYADQQRYAYTFQSIAFRTRINNLKNYNGEIIERSVFTDKNVFAKTCYENNKMNEIEWTDYCSWFDWLTENFKIKAKGFIYLRADPEISYQRIKKRNRSGEENIPMEYIKKLHDKHDNWLLNEKNVLVLDVNESFEDNPEVLIEKIKKFIEH
jgi:deoxycitidine kinase